MCVCVCGWQKPEDPNLNQTADNANTGDRISGLGSPFYIFDYYLTVQVGAVITYLQRSFDYLFSLATKMFNTFW